MEKMVQATLFRLPPDVRTKALVARDLYLQSITVSDPIPAVFGMVMAVGKAMEVLKDEVKKDSQKKGT